MKGARHNNNSYFNRNKKKADNETDSEQEPPQAVIDDLYFVCVASLDERQTRWWERIMTYLERAYWRYDDHWRKMYPNLRRMKSMKEFARMMFERVDNLQPHQAQFDEIFRSWTAYKRSIRQSGAILLNQDMNKVLLVKGPGSMPWGLPKGKCEKQEVLQPHLGAIREVREETGFDITNHLQHKHKIIRKSGRGGNGGDLVMYVIVNVPEDYPFDSECKAEVAQIGWHEINTLPTTRSMDRIKDTRNGREIRYGRGIRALVEPLRKWIHKYKTNPGMDTLVETSTVDPEDQVPHDEVDDHDTANTPPQLQRTDSEPILNSHKPRFDVPQLLLDTPFPPNSAPSQKNSLVNEVQQTSSDHVQPLISSRPIQQIVDSVKQSTQVWANFKLDAEVVMQCIDKACANKNREFGQS